jgi:hypothetical protein
VQRCRFSTLVAQETNEESYVETNFHGSRAEPQESMIISNKVVKLFV